MLTIDLVRALYFLAKKPGLNHQERLLIKEAAKRLTTCTCSSRKEGTR